MPETLPEDINIEKNKLATDSAWLWLLDIESDDFATLHFVNNIENIVYNGTTYTACNFNMEAYNKSEPSKLSDLTLSITNADLINAILPYVDDYDGLLGCIIVRTPINSSYLNLDMSNKSEEFLVKGCSVSDENISFVLGAPNPLSRRFPPNRYFGNYCRYVKNFGGAECGYDLEDSGADTTCNGTPSDCESKNNLARFGGQPGLRSKTVRFV